MNGTIEIANNTKGLGFIRGEDGQKYFYHHSDVMMEGFRCLAKGWNVTFEPAQGEKGLVGKKITPTTTPGLTRNQRVASLNVHGDHLDASIRIDALGRIYVTESAGSGGKAIPADLEGPYFRAYYAGAQHLRGTQFAFPASSAEHAFVLLDPQKNMRKMEPGGLYKSVHPGSYFVKVTSNGQATVWNLGRRIQGNGEQWLVIERRFHHKYDLNADIKAQTPTSGLDRDNDGFIPAIVRAKTFLDSIRNQNQQNGQAEARA